MSANQMQGFIDDLVHAAGNASGGLPLLTKIAQNPQQFVKNAAGGAGNLVKSTVALPGQVYNSVKNGTEPQDLQKFAKGAISSYGKIAQDPTQAMYNDPVNTTLAVAPAVGALGKIGSIGKATEEAGAIPGGIAKDIPDTAAQSFNSRYTVPTKRAGKNDLNTLDTSKELLAHVKSGMDVNSIDSTPDLVTGQHGIISKMTRDAAGGISSEIPLGEPLQAATNILNNNKVLVNDTMRQNAIDDIGQSSPTSETVGKMNAQDALDYARQLEAKAAQFGRSSTYMTPRPEMEVLQKAYSAAADSVMEQVDHASKGVNIEGVKTPENMQALRDISPRLAAQVAAAKDVSSLRSTAAPFVKLSKMQDLDQAAKNSTFSQVAQGMKKPAIQPASAAGAAVGGAIGGLPGAGIGYGLGNIVDRTLAPEYAAGMNKIQQPLENMMLNRRLNGQGVPGLGAIGSLGKAAALPALGAQSTPQNEPQQQNKPAAIPNQGNHASTITENTANVKPIAYSDIPQDVKQIQPDPKTGQYTIASPQAITDKTGQPLAMSDTDYKDLKKGYQQQLGTLEVKYNPKLSAQIQSQLDQLETTHGQSKELQDDYSNAQSIQNTAQTAIDLLKDAPAGLFNQNGLVDNYNTLFNGKYAGLKESIGILQKYYPVLADSVLKSANSGVALSVLSKIPQRVAQDYYQKINTVTGNVPGVPKQSVQQAATSQGLPPINAGGNGGSVQGTPHPFVY